MADKLYPLFAPLAFFFFFSRFITLGFGFSATVPEAASFSSCDLTNAKIRVA
jgi:hypothetical protein